MQQRSRQSSSPFSLASPLIKLPVSVLPSFILPTCVLPFTSSSTACTVLDWKHRLLILHFLASSSSSLHICVSPLPSLCASVFSITWSVTHYHHHPRTHTVDISRPSLSQSHFIRSRRRKQTHFSFSSP